MASRSAITALLLAFASSVAFTAGGCSTSSSSAGSSDAGDESTDDTGESKSSDGGTKTKKTEDDAGVETGADAGGGGVCSFNRECIASERCECVDGDCVCKPGKRGTGKSGIDMCTDGNDCESSVCLEGPGDVLYCSGECATGKDCGGVLPTCSEIALLGKICVRASK